MSYAASWHRLVNIFVANIYSLLECQRVESFFSITYFLVIIQGASFMSFCKQLTGRSSANWPKWPLKTSGHFTRVSDSNNVICANISVIG